MQNPFTTRKATRQDIKSLLKLAQKMHNEGVYREIEINQSKLKEYFISKILAYDSLVLVLIKNDIIVGLFVAEIVSYFFSDENMALDNLFYIDKSYRKSFGAGKLLNDYFNWANQYAIKEICLSNTNGVETDKVEKMYVKLGFKKVGVMYKKEV